MENKLRFLRYKFEGNLVMDVLFKISFEMFFEIFGKIFKCVYFLRLRWLRDLRFILVGRVFRFVYVGMFNLVSLLSLLIDEGSFIKLE